MGRICTICVHPQRTAVEAELNAGWPLRGIAERHGLSKTALHRHKHLHLVRQPPVIDTTIEQKGMRTAAITKWVVLAAGLYIAIRLKKFLEEALNPTS